MRDTGRRKEAPGLAGLLLLAAAASCARPPQVARATVTQGPGDSIVVARVQVPEAVSGVAGAAEPDAARVTIQAEGSQAVPTIALTPAGYFLASLPLDRYRLLSWETRVARTSRFGTLEIPFEVPLPEKLYYLGALSLVGQTTERYRLQGDDRFVEAMRYLVAKQPQLVGT